MNKKKIRIISISLAAAIAIAAVVVFLCVKFIGPSRGGMPANHNHTDADNNGLCDKCKQSVCVTLDFYVINDLHGKFADSANQPGVDELTKFFKVKAMIGENMVLLSSGDMWQGSSESNLTKGLIITDWMNELGFASMTLGNHEYDWGEEYIKANADAAKFPFLAINIYDRSSNELVSYCQPSAVIERAGVKIGIIGAMGDCYSSIASDYTKDIYFVNGIQLGALVKAEANRLRTEEKCDLIIYSIHDGNDENNSGKGIITDSRLASYYDISLSNGVVDIVFEGHTHKSYVAQDRYGVYHLQDGGENQGISHAAIVVNTANSNKKVTKAEFISSSVYRKENGDALRDELLDKYADIISVADEVLGKNSRTRYKEDILPVIAKLYYEKAEEKWGNDYEIVLGGGYLSFRSPYEIPAGDVKYKDIQAVLPFDNELVLCAIKGIDLQHNFIENEKYYSYYSEYGKEVKQYLELDKSYYIIVDSYTSTYAPNNITEIERLGQPIFARDLLAEYVKQGGLQ